MSNKLSLESKKKFLLNQFYAFNIWDINSAKAVIDASTVVKRPVFLQVSSKIFNLIDKEEFVYVIKRHANIKNIQLLLNLDHCRDLEQIKEAVRYGWDSVMYDGSHLSIEENIKITNEVSGICKRDGVLVEAEIGEVMGVEDDIQVYSESSVEIGDVVRFIDATDVDLLAVAIGTAHGQYGTKRPEIDYTMIQKIGTLTDIPFVVHGGSELPPEILNKLFSYKNVKKVNISTDLKQAFRKGIITALNCGLVEEKGFDATKVNQIIYNEIREIVLNKLEIFKGGYYE
jgi:ketose-bisphosphate aldolase